jgi:hypothetical protein
MAPGKTTIHKLGNTRGRPPCRPAFTSERHGARHERQIPASPQSVDDDSSNMIASRRRSPLKFIVLVFALSIPLWLIVAVTELQLLPDLQHGS